MRGVFLPARRTHREDNTSRERWAELYSMYQAGAPIWANTAQSEAVRARTRQLKDESLQGSPNSSPAARRAGPDSSRLFDKKRDGEPSSPEDDEKAKQRARQKEKAKAKAAAARKAKAKAAADAAKAAAAAAAKAEEHRLEEEKKRAAAAEARAARQAAAMAAKAKHEAHVAKMKAAAEAHERKEAAKKQKAEHDRHEQEMRAKLEEAKKAAEKKKAEAQKHRRASVCASERVRMRCLASSHAVPLLGAASPRASQPVIGHLGPAAPILTPRRVSAPPRGVHWRIVLSRRRLTTLSARVRARRHLLTHPAPFCRAIAGKKPSRSRRLTRRPSHRRNRRQWAGPSPHARRRRTGGCNTSRRCANYCARVTHLLRGAALGLAFTPCTARLWSLPSYRLPVAHK